MIKIASVMLRSGLEQVIMCSGIKHLDFPPDKEVGDLTAVKYPSVEAAIDDGWFFVRDNNRCPECTMNIKSND